MVQMASIFAVVLAVSFLQGMVCANLLKWSVMTNIRSYPLQGGIDKKTTHTNSNGADDVMLTSGAISLLVPAFLHRHLSHSATAFSMSLNVPGQKNLLLISSKVFFLPGCPVSTIRLLYMLQAEPVQLVAYLVHHQSVVLCTALL